MRDDRFEQKLIELQRQIHGRLDKIASPTSIEIAVSGLASKSLSHTGMALELVVSGASEEAIILLRAAYEAVIRGIYLSENPDKLDAYKAFSAITVLRNQLELIKLLDEFDEPYDDRDLQIRLIEEQKQKILAAGYHQLFKLKEADLDSWNAMKKATNRSNMPSFEEVRRSISMTPLVKALLTTGFQTYNVGSQMAHSNLEMVTTMVFFQKSHPLYTESSIYRQVLLLLLSSCQCFAASSVISKDNFEYLRKEYERIGKEFLIGESA